MASEEEMTKEAVKSSILLFADRRVAFSKLFSTVKADEFMVVSAFNELVENREIEVVANVCNGDPYPLVRKCSR